MPIEYSVIQSKKQRHKVGGVWVDYPSKRCVVVASPKTIFNLKRQQAKQKNKKTI